MIFIAINILMNLLLSCSMYSCVRVVVYFYLVYPHTKLPNASTQTLFSITLLSHGSLPQSHAQFVSARYENVRGYKFLTNFQQRTFISNKNYPLRKNKQVSSPEQGRANPPEFMYKPSLIPKIPYPATGWVL